MVTYNNISNKEDNTVQPSNAGYWVDGGIPVFFDGVENHIVEFDTNTGSENTSVFGTDLSD